MKVLFKNLASNLPGIQGHPPNQHIEEESAGGFKIGQAAASGSTAKQKAVTTGNKKCSAGC